MAERKRLRDSSPADDNEELDEEEKQRSIRIIVAGLLTQKERLTDGLLSLLTERNGGGSQLDGGEEDNFGFYDGVSEDDKQLLVEAAKDKLGALSPVICNKLLPLVVKQLVDEHERRVSASFGRIRLPKSPTDHMAKMYRAAFRQWTDSPFVSYVAGNQIQLGSLSPKECFVLHVYSILGCFRAKPDDCYAVAITGETSVGKSLIFENPFSANSHQFLSQEGCGRWQIGKHSLVMYHDINLSVLLRPSECEMFKTLARTEMSSTKIFGGATTIAPLFVVVTSNQRVHPHEVSEPSRELRDRVKKESEETYGSKTRKPDLSKQLLLPCWRPPVLPKRETEAARSPSKKTQGIVRTLSLESNLRPASQIDSPNVRALQSRILEAHCFQRPFLEPWCIPRGEKFTRAHVLLGVYELVLSILESHERHEFYSWPLVSYALTTLCMVSRFFGRHMEDGSSAESRLRAVLEKLEPDPEERQLYFDLI